MIALRRFVKGLLLPRVAKSALELALAERDAAIRARDIALCERNAAIRERDAATRERDAATLVGIPTLRDRELTGDARVRKPKFFYHLALWEWLAGVANNPEVKVLELGSREVASTSRWKKHIPRADYIGFDYLPGKNVDVVGDAHRLAEYFAEGTFDVVISSAVFEHLAMPWVVAEEISKVLKLGGLVGIETHFSFSEHEMPWNFFQFNAEALKVLFNAKLGFEILDSGMSNPIVGRFSIDASEYLVGKPVPALYCHSSILAKKVARVLDKSSQPFDWRDLAPSICTASSYPANTGFSNEETRRRSRGAVER
jgi:SAM-dependent methyltransferase